MVRSSVWCVMTCVRILRIIAGLGISWRIWTCKPNVVRLRCGSHVAWPHYRLCQKHFKVCPYHCKLYDPHYKLCHLTFNTMCNTAQVATPRVRTAAKAEIPHLDDHVSKLHSVGNMTQTKLQDIKAAAIAVGVHNLVVPLNTVTKGMSLSEKGNSAVSISIIILTEQMLVLIPCRESCPFGVRITDNNVHHLVVCWASCSLVLYVLWMLPLCPDLSWFARSSKVWVTSLYQAVLASNFQVRLLSTLSPSEKIRSPEWLIILKIRITKLSRSHELDTSITSCTGSMQIIMGICCSWAIQGACEFCGAGPSTLRDIEKGFEAHKRLGDCKGSRTNSSRDWQQDESVVSQGRGGKTTLSRPSLQMPSWICGFRQSCR